MTDKLLCPFCQRDMERDGYQIQCRDRDCREQHDMYGSYNLWQALIDTKKKLDIAVDALEKIGSGDIIEHSVVGHEDDNKIFIANTALEQIKDKEQQ